MKPAYFVCSLVLIAAPVFGQSTPFKPNQTQTPPSFSRLSQGPGRSNAAGRRNTHPQAPGLNFATAVTYPLDQYGADSVAVADVNGDGKPDLLVTTLGGVGVLLGNGDGTFQTVTVVPYGVGLAGADSVAAADVNGDGKIDLLVASRCSNPDCTGAVGVLLGNGDGTFQSAVTYGSGGFAASSIAVADVNGDGKPDLLVTNLCDNSSDCGNAVSSGIVGVLLGNGDGTFQTVMTYGTGAYGAASVAVADVNRDGKPDLLIANWCILYDYGQTECDDDGTVDVLLGNGDGTFQPPVAYDSGGQYAYSVAVADLNGDGNPDWVVADVCDYYCPFETGVVEVALGNGDGTFQTPVSYVSPGYQPSSVAIADVNGDGKPDLIVTVAYIGGLVGVLLGNGDGTFQTLVTYASGAGAYDDNAVAVADVNGDDKPDLAVANIYSYTTSTVGVLINISTFPTTTALVSSLNPSNSGQTVTFTATVTPQYEFGNGTPTETVSFFDGATSLGNSFLNSSGVATLSISTLAVGTHSITATYNGDSNFNSSTSPVLSQVVQGAIVQISPTSVNFGNQTVGMGGNQGVLVNLTNTGNIALTISSIGITGADSADYFEAGLCPSPLAVGGSCTLTVSFTPTTTGTRTAALNFTDSAANSPQMVSLTGVGVLPAVSLSPASLTFPTQVVFTSSNAQTVTLSNTGVGTMSITNIATKGAFTQTNNCGSTVNSGSSCTLNVTFKPTKSGSITGSLSITDNAPLSPQTVSLKGTGTDVQLSPSSFNFGNQPVGTKSLGKKFTLTNKASVAVSITKISLSGTDASDFTETNTCGSSVGGGKSCFITVTFTPAVDGKRTADISVSDNGGGSPQTVSLSGTGTP